MADAFAVAFNSNGFFIGVVTGTENQVFWADPEGAKAFSINLAQQIEKFESTIRPIDASGLSPQIMSPIQRNQ